MSSAHKVALVLHGLQQQDRQWLLEQLPASHRDAVSKLVSEVENLSLAPAAHLFEQVMREKSQHTMSYATASASQQLEHRKAQSIFDTLQGEPDWVAASLLHARPAWEAELLSLYGTEQRAQICKLSVHTSTTPATRGSLVAALLAQLDLQRDFSPSVISKLPSPPTSSPWMQRLKGIRKWLP